MSVSTELLTRSDSKCELCAATEQLNTYTVPPRSGESPDEQIVLCATCLDQIDDPDSIDPNHWHCLNESIWSTVPAVQVMAYRVLKQLNETNWAQDLLNMIYMDEATMDWAKNKGDAAIIHLDSNGNVLQSGDTVSLIQDLNVKGANFTAKRGTAVRRIRLVPDNPEQIEGKVEGQQIVILTKYVKKSN
ncbi:MAG: PhnA domain-containing protein [Lewinella sp.]|nr:PhnA domain-containing protein [Lewinella sp.]